MPSAALDTLLTAYLGLHAVLALLIDVQSILPDVAPAVYALYERAGLTAVVAGWVKDEGDFLVGTNPLWFKSIVCVEILFQAPLCFALTWGFAKRRQWVRLPSLMYGAHVLTTMVPIMVVLCTDPRPTLTCKLVYAIWVFLPALLIARCAPGNLPLFDAPKRTLWKIALRPDVEKWEASAKLIGSTLDLGDDFLHTSDARMVRKVAAMFFKGQPALLLQIDPDSLPPTARWLQGDDISDAALITARSKEGGGGGDFVRLLPDGCAHLHLRAPLPMKCVVIKALELKDGEHVFPPGCA